MLLKLPLFSSNISKNTTCCCFILIALSAIHNTETISLNDGLTMFQKLQIIHFTICFEFMMFLLNDSQKYTDRQTSCLLETQHAHCRSLRPTNSVHCPFNLIRFDNRHIRITYYFYTLSQHCFTRKSNRFNCRL